MMEGSYQISGRGRYSRRQFVGQLSLMGIGGMTFAGLQGLTGCASVGEQQTEKQADEQPVDRKLESRW